MLIYLLLICGMQTKVFTRSGDTKATVMDIATARKDCVAFISITGEQML